jgi:hypothetical protein
MEKWFVGLPDLLDCRLRVPETCGLVPERCRIGAGLKHTETHQNTQGRHFDNFLDQFLEIKYIKCLQ